MELDLYGRQTQLCRSLGLFALPNHSLPFFIRPLLSRNFARANQRDRYVQEIRSEKLLQLTKEEEILQT